MRLWKAGTHNAAQSKWLTQPLNTLNILATMLMVQTTAWQCDERDSPLSPVPSHLSSIKTPPMNISALENWETSSDARTFNSEDKYRKIYFLLQSLPSTATPETKEEFQHGDVLLKKRGSVAACLRSLRPIALWNKRHPGSSTDCNWTK